MEVKRSEIVSCAVLVVACGWGLSKDSVSQTVSDPQPIPLLTAGGVTKSAVLNALGSGAEVLAGPGLVEVGGVPFSGELYHTFSSSQGVNTILTLQNLGEKDILVTRDGADVGYTVRSGESGSVLFNLDPAGSPRLGWRVEGAAGATRFAWVLKGQL